MDNLPQTLPADHPITDALPQTLPADFGSSSSLPQTLPADFQSQGDNRNLWQKTKDAFVGPTTAVGTPLTPTQQEEFDSLKQALQGHFLDAAKGLIHAEGTSLHVIQGSPAEKAIQILNPNFKGGITRAQVDEETANQAINKPLVDIGQAVDKNKNPVLKAIAETASSLTTPGNVAILASTGGFGLVESPIKLAMSSKLLSAGFTAQAIGQLYQHSKAFQEAYEKGDTNEALYQITHAVTSGAMSVLSGAHAAGKELPLYSPGDARIAGAMSVLSGAHAAGKELPLYSPGDARIAGAVADTVTKLGSNAADKLSNLVGKTTDFNTAIERMSPPSAKQYTGYMQKVADVKDDLQDIFNKNKNTIEDPATAAAAIQSHLDEQNNQMIQRAGATRYDAQPVVPDLMQRVDYALDDFFSKNKGLHGSAEDVRDAKTAVRERLLQEKNPNEPGDINQLRQPNLFETENIRRGLNRDAAPQYATNARPTSDAYKAAANITAGVLRDAIDESFQNKGLANVQETRQKEANLIDIRDQLLKGQKRAEDAGQPGIWKSIFNKIGSPAAIIAIGLGHPVSGAAIGFAVAADYVHGNLTNPNINAQRAVELAGRNPNARADTVLDVTNNLIPEGNSPVTEGPHPRENSPLHADLASHYGLAIGEDGSSYPELENRLLNGPRGPEERQLLKSMNDTHAQEVEQAKKAQIERAKALQQQAQEQKAREAENEQKRQEAAAKGIVDPSQEPFEVGEHLEVPDRFAKKGVTPERVLAHEAGHLISAADAGRRIMDVISHNHDDISPGALAEARWDKSDFQNEDGEWDDSKLKQHLPEILRHLYAGPVAEELIHGVPVDKNPLAAGDLKRAKGLIKALGFQDAELGAMMKTAEMQARELMNRPGVKEVLERYTRNREAGLKDDVLISGETAGKLTQEIKNLGGKSATPESRPDANPDGEGGGKTKPGRKGPAKGGLKKEVRPAGETGAAPGSDGEGKPKPEPTNSVKGKLKTNAEAAETPQNPPKIQSANDMHNLGRDHDIPSETGYVYHATNAERALDIAQSQLDPHSPDFGTDQSVWPDGSTHDRSYFTRKANVAWQFAPEDGKSVLLRMKEDPKVHKTESGTGDVYATKPIPAEKLEILNKDRQWVPMADQKSQRVDGDTVVKHIMDTSSIHNEDDAHQLAGLDSAGQYDLKDVPVKKLKQTNEVDSDLVKKYADTKTPLPAIVLDGDGRLRDGNHRLAAAKLRGDETIKAYVPVDSTTGESRDFSDKPVRDPFTPKELDEMRAAYPLKTEARIDQDEVLDGIRRAYGAHSDPEMEGSASFITKEGKHIDLPSGVDHTEAIEQHGGGNGVRKENGRLVAADNRRDFVNETGTIRVHKANEGNKQVLAFSVPKNGVSPEQITEMEKSVAANSDPNGVLRIERADINPGNFQQAHVDKEQPNPKDVRDILSRIYGEKQAVGAGARAALDRQIKASENAAAQSQERDKYYTPGGRLRIPGNALNTNAEADRVSTRVPEGKNATENPLEGEPLTVGRESLSKAPEKLQQKFADTVRNYPGVKIPESIKDPSKVMDMFVNHVKDNLKFVYDLVTPEKQKANAKWYESAHKLTKDTADEYGISHPQEVAVMATQSPQKDWDMNASLARRITDIYHKQQDTVTTPEMIQKGLDIVKKTGANEDLGKAIDNLRGKRFSDLTDPYDRAAWVRLYDEAHNPREFYSIDPATGENKGLRTNADGSPTKIAWGSLSQIDNALSVLSDGSRENISKRLGGMHKVRNFYNNIIAPENDQDVTIDTHAVTAALIQPLGGTADEVLDNFGKAGKHAGTGTMGTYPLYADAYRKAAAELGIKPRELQSVVWEHIRNMFPSEWKSPANEKLVKDIWKKYSDGKQSLNQTRQEILKLSEQAQAQVVQSRAEQLAKAKNKLDKKLDKNQ